MCIYLHVFKALMCPKEGTVAPIAVRVQVSNSESRPMVFLGPTKTPSPGSGLYPAKNARLFR